MIIDENNLEEVIDDAIRENAAKEHLRGIERRRKIRWISYPVVAAAAVAVVLLILDLRVAETGYDAATRILNGSTYLDIKVYRNIDYAHSVLNAAAISLSQDRLCAAEDSLDVAATMIATELANLGDDDSDYSERLELKDLSDDVMWLRALLYLKSKKPRKARTVLESISAEGRTYSVPARDIIEEVWGK